MGMPGESWWPSAAPQWVTSLTPWAPALSITGSHTGGRAPEEECNITCMYFYLPRNPTSVIPHNPHLPPPPCCIWRAINRPGVFWHSISPAVNIFAISEMLAHYLTLYITLCCHERELNWVEFHWKLKPALCSLSGSMCGCIRVTRSLAAGGMHKEMEPFSETREMFC